MITKEEKIGLITGKLVRVCNRCECEVVYDEYSNYDCTCLVCDEDLDFWETKLITKESVKMFITEEDKKHYIEHGHLPNEKLDWLEKTEK